MEPRLGFLYGRRRLLPRRGGGSQSIRKKRLMQYACELALKTVKAITERVGTLGGDEKSGSPSGLMSR